RADVRSWIDGRVWRRISDPVVGGDEDVAAVECGVISPEIDPPVGRSPGRIVHPHPLAVGVWEAAFARCKSLPLVQRALDAVADERLEIGGENVPLLVGCDLGVAPAVLAVRLLGENPDRVPVDALIVGL